MKKGINNKKKIVLSGVVVTIVAVVIIILWQTHANKQTTTGTKNEASAMSLLTSDTNMIQSHVSKLESDNAKALQESKRETSKASQSNQGTISKGKTQETTTKMLTSEPMDKIKNVAGVVIVNKKYKLPSTYAPGENKEAGQAFRRLISEMQSKGFSISNHYSGYRSYQYQMGLYQNYVAQNGKEKADRFSARPGHSEHQTGLAFDMLNGAGQLLGTQSSDKGAVDYLAKNAHRFGFVVRYLKGKEHITGYMAEEWHVRYVGDKATAIYQSGLTLEEYFNVSGGDYAS